jgi:hypothetical protein
MPAAYRRQMSTICCWLTEREPGASAEKLNVKMVNNLRLMTLGAK